VATDEENLEIPWVRYTNLKTGKSIDYIDEENPIEITEITPGRIKVMDCMDCHNRPSHSYQPPAFFVNQAITAGEIPASLPDIKSLAMEICAEEFPDADSARVYIKETLTNYYMDNYEDISKDNPNLIDTAVNGLVEAYTENIFPYMRVKWDAYPNHIGHLEFEGCFRCHNDRHTSEEGQVISRDCDACHQITAQGTPGEKVVANLGKSLEFIHPADVGEDWKEMMCTECHTGLNP
jgi:hypothetical protein